jgi:hypothetical protein
MLGLLFIIALVAYIAMISAPIFMVYAAVLAYGVYPVLGTLTGFLVLPMVVDRLYGYFTGKQSNLTAEIKSSLMASMVVIGFSFLGIPLLIRGLTQIVTTPLTWFLKIPFRFILTALIGHQKIENDRGINRLLNASTSLMPYDDKYRKIEIKLMNKLNKAHAKGRDVPEGVVSLLEPNCKGALLFFRPINILEKFTEIKPFLNSKKYDALVPSKKIELIEELGKPQRRVFSGTVVISSSERGVMLKKHGVFLNRVALEVMLISSKRWTLSYPYSAVPRDIWKMIGGKCAVLPPEQSAESVVVIR